MFEIFPDGPIHEYPQLVNIAFSFIWAFILSSIIAITHRFTYTGGHYPAYFFQSLILGAIVTTMVMMAIGDSLARGLGVFGAMAIIRFRTRIDDPRDVLFLFTALSTGLAIGVYGFTISFAGTILFCLAAVVLHVSPFRSFFQRHQLSFTLADRHQIEAVTAILARYCSDYHQTSLLLTKENEFRFTYGISMQNVKNNDAMVEALMLVEGIKQIKLSINENIGG
jgi:hypothetical protein